MAKRAASNSVATKRQPVRTSAARKAGKSTTKSAGTKAVSIDRRRGERRADSKPAASSVPKLERRQKVNRRRQIDPTTCERDYTDEEIEFMNALDVYKRKSGRMFPTCSEVLEVIRGLGYAKNAGATSAKSNVLSSDSDASSAISKIDSASALISELDS